MTTETKPEVWMICMTDHPLSMYYRGRVEESWTSRGFNINISEAVTPSTVDHYKNLKWRQLDGILSGYRWIRGKTRNLTEREKAVWLSHYNLWEYARTINEPIIVIEHDAYLTKDIPDNLFGESIAVVMGHKEKSSGQLSTYPATAYYLTQTGARELVRHTKSMSASKKIGGPVDALIYHFVKHSIHCKFESTFVKQIENLGSTLDHHLLQQIDCSGNLI